MGENYFQNNLNQLKLNSNIYYAEIENGSDEELMTIEANIQYFLIREFKLDVYKDYEYKIGLTFRKNTKYIDKKVKIINILESIPTEKRIVFYNHFGNCKNCDFGIIDFTNEKDEIIKAIQYKRVDQKWSDIIKS